jgi:hypothetical protein
MRLVAHFSSGDSGDSIVRDRPLAGGPAQLSDHEMKSALISSYEQISGLQPGNFVRSWMSDSRCWKWYWQCWNIASLCQVGPTDTSLKTMGHIAKFDWTVLPHPPYSPDLTPSSFHLFGTMTDGLQAVRKWFTSDGVDFYKRSMKADAHCWWECIASGGDYVEQQCFVSENLLYSTALLSTLYLL